ncbi:uncharacterized protein LOC134219359 [Armigeres subalbatus]|uniref:uncharacterized protein LOC134219359 n=1 Tax=Armigeres subalbatus TaxID=124917 RepID=UPI002ED5EED7
MFYWVSGVSNIPVMPMKLNSSIVGVIVGKVGPSCTTVHSYLQSQYIGRETVYRLPSINLLTKLSRFVTFGNKREPIDEAELGEATDSYETIISGQKKSDSCIVSRVEFIGTSTAGFTSWKTTNKLKYENIVGGGREVKLSIGPKIRYVGIGSGLGLP